MTLYVKITLHILTKKDRLKIPASTWSNVLSASSDTCHEERIMIIFPKYIV